MGIAFKFPGVTSRKARTLEGVPAGSGLLFRKPSGGRCSLSWSNCGAPQNWRSQGLSPVGVRPVPMSGWRIEDQGMGF